MELKDSMTFLGSAESGEYMRELHGGALPDEYIQCGRWERGEGKMQVKDIWKISMCQKSV